MSKSGAEIAAYTILIDEAATNPAKDADLMALSNAYRSRFKELVKEKESQKNVVNFLNRFVSDFYFTSMFFQLSIDIIRFALFAEVIVDKLIKKGSDSTLKDQLRNLLVEKSTVRYQGVITNPVAGESQSTTGYRRGGSPVPPRATIPEVMADLRTLFQISDEEALLINEVIDVLLADSNTVELIINNINKPLFLPNHKYILRERITNYYLDHNWDDRLIFGPYVSPGGIIDYIIQSVIDQCRAKSA